MNRRSQPPTTNHQSPFSSQHWAGKTAVVIGLGRSGAACARLLAKNGFAVLASDMKPSRELQPLRRSLPRSVRIFGGGHPEKALAGDFAVKSPGLKPGLPVFARLQKRGIPIFSELDIALAFSKSRRVVAITGTNGKSTTTALTGEIFRRALTKGRKALVGGNIGVPVSEIAPKAGPEDALILEVSSYQLEDSRGFHPQASAILNITPDHMDHHGTFGRYLAAKARVFMSQTAEDCCVFNADDPQTMRLSRRCPARRLYFSIDKKPGVHAFVSNGRIEVRFPGKKNLRFDPPHLPGRHNLENAMAAILLALASDLSPAGIQKGLNSFKGLEHRLEEAAPIDGIRCINDSKATNVDSTVIALKALESESGGILLILGGLDKGNPYGPLRPLIEKKVKAIFTIGSAAPKIEKELRGSSAFFNCGDLRTAIKTAVKAGSPGDILLLSPACASFDQFENFEDRGRRFKALVRHFSS